MTHDDETVERAARAIYAARFKGLKPQMPWESLAASYADEAEYNCKLARAALSALPADDALEGLRASAIGLCAAIDNLWNHPDLVRVRSEIPESIKLNISRHQLQVRAKLAAPAQEPRS